MSTWLVPLGPSSLANHPWLPSRIMQAPACLPALYRLKGNSPLPESRIYRLRTTCSRRNRRITSRTVPHPHMHLLVRCLDGRQTHPSTENTSGIRRILYGHSVAESVDTDKYKRFYGCTLRFSSVQWKCPIFNVQ